MRPAARYFLFVPALAGFFALFAWGLAGLAPLGRYPGPYGDLVNAVSVPERHIANAVTAVNFDIRGVDTMGEEFIMFLSVIGVVMLLRRNPPRRGESDGGEDRGPGRSIPPVSDAVRVLTVGLIGPAIAFGIYVVTHGQVSPGGGFQGGVILATAPLLVYLAGEFDKLARVAPKRLLEIAEGAGAAAYVAIGGAAMAAGLPFLANVLPLGKSGSVAFGGTVAFIDFAVGMEVAASFVLLLVTFLEETLRRKEPE